MKIKAKLLVLDGSLALDMENEIDATDFDRRHKLIVTSYAKITTMPANNAGTLLICEQWVSTGHAVAFDDLLEWEKELLKKWETFEWFEVVRVNADRKESAVLFAANEKIHQLHHRLRRKLMNDVKRNVVIEYLADESNPG